MAANKPFLAIDMDYRDVEGLAGYVTTLSQNVNTDASMGPVLEYAFEAMSRKFDAYMSVIAPMAPVNFHHVYEWNNIGNTHMQLWKNTLRGRGANRVASFQFRASKVPVPIPRISNDPGRGTLRGTHRFVYKAIVMEYDIPVTIRPKKAKVLAFPHSVTGELVFTKGPVTIEHPGGSSTTGAFTAAWVDWWTGAGADMAFKEEISKRLSDDFSEKAMAKFIRRFKRVKSTKAKLSVADYQKAFADGSANALEFLKERAEKNRRRAASHGV